MLPEHSAALDVPAIEALRPAALHGLDGRTALVTGAVGEIGRWLAAGLGAAGAHVVLTDREPEPLEEVAGLLRGAGIEATWVAADLTDDGGPERIVAAARAPAGRLDILVNGAAINRRQPILEVEPATFDAIVAVDLRAPYLLAQAAARAMIDAGHGGSIVNIGSINVAVGLDGVSVYGAAKAGLSQLTKVMAVEWSRHGIRANCLCPGFMMTALSRPVWEDPVRRAWILDRVPMRRPGYARELVAMCVLLASNAGSFTTGQTVFIDGGFLAGTSWDAG